MDMLPQCAFSHFGAGVKTSIIFVRKRGINEPFDDNEEIFMAAPEMIGYDATGKKTESQLNEVIKEYEKFKAKQDMQYISSMDKMYQKYLEENKNTNRT